MSFSHLLVKRQAVHTCHKARYDDGEEYSIHRFNTIIVASKQVHLNYNMIKMLHDLLVKRIFQIDYHTPEPIDLNTVENLNVL